MRDSRGAVLVLVAAAMFPIIAIMTFAIDVSHWFDYSRNLQNRADAAALAGAGQFGGICFAGGNPGNVTNGAQASIGQYAQLYSGLSVGENAANHFYTDATMSTLNVNGAPWNINTNGYINNTLAASPINSPLTLRAGLANINNYWVSQNANNYAPTAGGANTDFSMNTGGTGATFCSSDPTFDVTDAQCFGQAHGQTSGPCAVQPMIDVKVTQKNVPLFVPIFSGLNPTLHAHARVTLQGQQSSPTTPIAVGDTAFTPCVSVNLLDTSTNPPTLMQNVPLPNRSQATQTSPVQWSSNATSFTMPNKAVYVQPVLSDCHNTSQIYDDSTNTGLLAIGPHPLNSPTVNSGDPPAIDTGGVTVAGGPCGTGTQYFAVGACNVEIDVNAKFASDVTPANNAIVFMKQKKWDNVNNVYVTTTTQMNRPGQGGCPAARYCLNITIPDTDGIDLLSFTWEEDAGQIGTGLGATMCGNGNGHNPPPCLGQFNNGDVLQQVFGACNGCDQPDDSGPIIFARISQGGGSDVNTMAVGPQSNVVFSLQLAGLNTAQWLPPTGQIPFNPPPTILRFSVQGNHTTGLVDCGQGNGASADAQAIYGGCGPNNPLISGLPVLTVNTRNSCNPAPSASPWDCVQTTNGNRRNKIPCAIVLRIVQAPFAANCNGGGTCPANNWNTYQGHPPGGDPRAVTMILTADIDLATVGGAPNSWIPIYQFATFYVVGWDTSINPSCTAPGPGQNAPFPVKGKKNNQNAAIWGYWINYTTFGTPNGQPCPINSGQPVNCVPALTR
jgi:Putative Flp pilus-assembly TadE/G-like